MTGEQLFELLNDVSDKNLTLPEIKRTPLRFKIAVPAAVTAAAAAVVSLALLPRGNGDIPLHDPAVPGTTTTVTASAPVTTTPAPQTTTELSGSTAPKTTQTTPAPGTTPAEESTQDDVTASAPALETTMPPPVSEDTTAATAATATTAAVTAPVTTTATGRTVYITTEPDIAAAIPITTVTADISAPPQTTTTTAWLMHNTTYEAETTFTTTTTVYNTFVTTPLPEITTFPHTVTSPGETTPAPTIRDPSELTLIYRMESGNEFWREDIAEAAFGDSEYGNCVRLLYRCAPVRTAENFYLDSETTPEEFDMENQEFLYSETTPEISNVITIGPGMYWFSRQFESAETVFGTFDNNVTFEPLYSSFTLANTEQLRGLLVFIMNDRGDHKAGDMLFVPDWTYAYNGFPTIVDPTLTDPPYSLYFGDIAICTDAPIFRLGNLYTDYKRHTALNELFGGAEKDTEIKVCLDLNEITVRWEKDEGIYGTAQIINVIPVQ